MRTDTGLASRHQAPDPGQQRRDRVLLAVGIAVAAAAAGLYAVALATHPAISTLKGFDLQVYLKGGELARHSPAQLYSWQQRAGIQFTYTPFAALLFALITWVPFHVLLDLAAAVSIASLAATVWIAFRELGWRGWPGPGRRCW
jgi:alpha-1,2-mannosyltransferase